MKTLALSVAFALATSMSVSLACEGQPVHANASSFAVAACNGNGCKVSEPPQADRDPYADPAAPYKANRLQINGGMPRLDTPGQSTVLTREILDDMNATSLSDALRSTAGVTVGR